MFHVLPFNCPGHFFVNQHFDPRNELVVAREQFLRVLSAQGLLPTDSRLWPLLVRRYGVSDFRRQTTVHQVCGTEGVKGVIEFVLVTFRS